MNRITLYHNQIPSAYCTTLTKSIAKNNQIEERLSGRLLDENSSFVEEIKELQGKIVSMEHLLREKDEKLKNAMERERETESTLLEYEAKLEDHRKRETVQQTSLSCQKTEYASSLTNIQRMLSQAKHELKIVREENHALRDELYQTKRLFQRSQDALICKTTAITSGFPLSQEIDGDSTCSKKKSRTPTRQNLVGPFNDVMMVINQSKDMDVAQTTGRREQSEMLINTATSSSNKVASANMEQKESKDDVIQEQVKEAPNGKKIELGMKKVADTSFISEITFRTLHQKQEQVLENPSSSLHHSSPLDTLPLEESPLHNFPSYSKLPVLEQSSNIIGHNATVESLLEGGGSNENKEYSSVAVEVPPSAHNGKDLSVTTSTAKMGVEFTEMKVEENTNLDEETELIQDVTNEYDLSDFESESNNLLLLDKGKDIQKKQLLLQNGEEIMARTFDEDIILKPNIIIDNNDDHDIPKLPSTEEMIAITNMHHDNEQVASQPRSNDEDYEDSFEDVEEHEHEQEQIHDDERSIVKADATMHQDCTGTSNNYGTSSSSSSSSQFESSASASIQIYSSRDRTASDWW